MNNPNDLILKSKTKGFLRVWQILELAGLLFLIPVVFLGGILFTGDSSNVYDFVKHYIVPLMGLFLVVKIFVAIAFFKFKRWPLYFNFVQNVILCVLSLGVIILSIIAKSFPFLPILFMVLFGFIARANLKCLRDYFYQQVDKKKEK